MPTSKQKKVQSKSPVVRRARLVRPPISTLLPGYEGPRPQLSFVLKTLAGDDCGMTEMHLSTRRGWPTLEEDEIINRVSSDPRSAEITTNSMIAMMRVLSDLWIDSGKSGEGENKADNPLRRNVTYMPPPETPTIDLRIGPDGESIHHGWNAFSIPIGSISDHFDVLLSSEAHWPQIHENGTQSLKELIFGFTVENTLSGHRIALHKFGMKVAMYWFARLLNSPFSRHLARCDNCRAYFAYQRAPKKEIYGGIHCVACKHVGSNKRMKSTRDRRTSELVEFAANVWEKCKPDLLDGEKSKWVAEQVNQRTERVNIKAGREVERHYRYITGRWVTEYEDKIQAEVERRGNAKS